MLAGLIPLVPTILLLTSLANRSFLYSAVLTGVTFFVVGWVRGRVVNQRPFVSGAETLMIGGSAAFVAFFVGWLLESLAAT